MAKAGFIGLGAMGWHMAGHLARADLLGGVWNRTHATAEKFAAEFGTPAAAAPAELWARCDVVFLCVSADPQVLEMARALAVPAGRGRLVVDTSTVAGETAQAAAKILADAGIRFLDAPITGGTEGAKHARLTFMIGGSEADLAQAAPFFARMGAKQVHMGGIGAGQSTKAVNQVACAGIAQAVTEAVAFADAQGLPLEKVLEVVGSGAAGSWFMTNRGKNFISGQYPPGFKLALHLKDLRICRDMAKKLGGSLPVSDGTIPQYEELLAQGFGDDDISTLYRSNRQLFPRAGQFARGAPKPAARAVAVPVEIKVQSSASWTALCRDHAGLIFPRPRTAPERADRGVTAIFAGAGGRLAGLAVFEAIADGGARLISLAVDPALRRSGIARRLLRAAEERAQRAHSSSLSAVLRTHWPDYAAVEALLLSEGWMQPLAQIIRVRADAVSMKTSGLLDQMPIPPGSEIFGWNELTAAERQDIEARLRAPDSVIPAFISPFHELEGTPLEATFSTGLRMNGRVLAWMIVHRLDATTIQYTSSYTDPSLRRTRTTFALRVASTLRQLEAGIPNQAFEFHADNEPMVHYVEQVLKPHLRGWSEWRTTGKKLNP